MQIHYIAAWTLDNLWYQLLKHVLVMGYDYTVQRGSGKGSLRKQLPFVIFIVHRPFDRPLAPTVPPGVPAPTNDDAIQDYYLNDLAVPTRHENEQYTYGERLHISDLEALEMLAETPHTNQACAEIARPEDITLEDPPCARLLDRWVLHDALHYFLYFRSWDLWGDLPVNLGGFQIKKETEAKCLGLRDGVIIAASKGLYLYEYAWEWAKQRIGNFE